MRPLFLTFFLLAFGCTISPLQPEFLSLTAEPGLWSDATVRLKNYDPRQTLNIGAITFSPDLAPVRWTGPGPFEVEPRESSEIVVRFSPTEVGTWTETLTFTTNAGDFTLDLTLNARVGVDLDGDSVSVAMGDCNDLDPTVHPSAAEHCNQIDDDCDGLTDEDFDQDHDGFLSAEACSHGLDCDDHDKTAHPDQVEQCDQTDSDCNGITDDITDPADKQLGVCAGSSKICPNFGGPVEPHYPEIDGYETMEHSCDGLDNDCDGLVDIFDYRGDGTLDCLDDDGDGESEVEGDCDDRDETLSSESCGARKLGVTTLVDGFSVIDLNLWTKNDYPLPNGAYHGAALKADTIFLAARDHYTVLSVSLVPPWTLLETTSYTPKPMAVLPDQTGERLHILLADGTLLTRSLVGGVETQITGLGAVTAMTRDGDVLWICTSEGSLHKVEPATQTVETVPTFVSCYGPPIVDVEGNRVIVAGYSEWILTSFQRDNLSVITLATVEKRPLRGVMVGEALWVGGEKVIQIRTGPTLEDNGLFTFETAPVQGLWHDNVRGEVWVALQGANEIVAIRVSDRSIIHRLPVDTPVHLFEIPP